MWLNRLIAVVVLATSINAQCDFTSPDGLYKASWYLDSPAQIVHFKLSSTQRLPGGYWTGIGFGSKMQGADIIIVSSVNNQVTVSDRQGIGYGEPIEDSQQDVKNFKGRLENGVIQAEFTRGVDTKDAQDLPIIDKTKNNCQDFIFPVSGGAASPAGIQKHSNTPAVQRICNIDKCPPFVGDGGSPAGAAGAVTDSGAATTKGNPVASTTTLSAIVTGTPAPTTTPNVHIGASQTPEIVKPTTGLPTGGAQGTGIGTGLGQGFGAGKASCSFSEGDYSASWTFDPATQSVRFNINAPLSSNRWTGIGFGQTMQGGDMIIIYDNNGIVNISDRHGVGHTEPPLDAHDDITAFQNTYDGKKVQAHFTRLVNTKDAEDLPLQDPRNNNCQFFMFPVSPGSIVNQRDGKIAMGIHAVTPTVKQICGLSDCTAGAGTPQPAATETPIPTPGGAETRGTGFPPGGISDETCPPRDDHSACRNYINDYLTVVYDKFPKADPITQKACGLLQTHQQGIVFTECCHYMSKSQVCGRFLGAPQPPLAQPQPPQQQPQPIQQQPQVQPQPNGNVQLQQSPNRNPLPGRGVGGR